MSIGGLILGVLDIAIVAVLLILLGLVIEWVAKAFGYGTTEQMRKFYLLFVLLVVISMLVAMVLGAPRLRIIGSSEPTVNSLAPNPATVQRPSIIR